MTLEELDAIRSSLTSWEGHSNPPRWVVQYRLLLSEISRLQKVEWWAKRRAEQFAQDVTKPLKFMPSSLMSLAADARELGLMDVQP